MTVYKHPGVFIEETIGPLTNTLSTPGEALAAFVGKHGRGPAGATLVTSWSQFNSLYGGFTYATPGEYLAYSVFEFFNNGGHACFVVRGVASDSVAATLTLNDRQGSPVGLLKVTANSTGVWGNSLSVAVVDSADTGVGRFTLQVLFGGNIVETWQDVSLNPGDSRYAPGIVNSPSDSGSRFIKFTDLRSSSSAWTTASGTPAVVSATPLTTGAEGSATIALDVAAIDALEGVTQTTILNLNLPNVQDQTTINNLTAWAADSSRQTVFLVVDVPKAASTVAATVTSYTNLVSGPDLFTATSYAAIYGPWLTISDPAVSSSGAVKVVPPGGAVLGQYSATDASRGVQKPPAGVGTALKGVVDLENKFKGSDLDTLNEAGINVVRTIPGYGFCIMGARTLKRGFPDRYINIRRVLMYVKKVIKDNTQFAIHEPNDEELWAVVSATVSGFLMTAFQDGLLKGTTPDAAFFVKCDAENNPPSSTSVGVLNVQVGVSVATPAEFIVINIGLFDGGSTTTENATS